MFYVDTSVFVSALTDEETTNRSQLWFAHNRSQDFAISEWTRTEFSSAMAQKLRMRHVDESERAAVLAQFETHCAETLTILPVAGQDFFQAARLVDQYATGLRANDALHVAVCMRHRATLCTNDLGLLKACALLGVPSINCAA